jgi:hypothetical protein
VSSNSVTAVHGDTQPQPGRPTGDAVAPAQRGDQRFHPTVEQVERLSVNHRQDPVPAILDDDSVRCHTGVRQSLVDKGLENMAPRDRVRTVPFSVTLDTDHEQRSPHRRIEGRHGVLVLRSRVGRTRHHPLQPRDQGGQVVLAVSDVDPYVLALSETGELGGQLIRPELAGVHHDRNDLDAVLERRKNLATHRVFQSLST